MPHLKGKYKGKTGKIAVAEEIMGTELLSGTYEGRKKNWKIQKHEKMLIADWEAKRLEAYRSKKEQEIRKTMADQVKVGNMNQKIGFLLPYLTEPDAYRYLFTMLQLEPIICQNILYYLFPPRDLKNLDQYVDVITKKGHGPKKKISLVTIMKIERKVRGIKNKIEVDRNGKRRRIG